MFSHHQQSFSSSNFLIIAVTLHFKLPNLVSTFQGLMHNSLEFSRHVNFELSKKKSFHWYIVTYA